MKHLLALARHIGKSEDADWINGKIGQITKVLLKFYDSERHCFVDKNCGLSWAAGIWGVLSGALDSNESGKVLLQLERTDPPLKMGTPYLVSYYVEALLSCGMNNKATETIKKYWGRMLDTGLDRFPEYLIDTKEHSEYYNEITNSYCHAWSATPAYFIGRLKNYRSV